jgi:glutamine synthetase
MTLAQRCSAHDAARQAACEQVLQRLHDLDIQQVRVAWADLHGSFRGKTLMVHAGSSALQDALQEGVGMVSTLLLKDSSDRTALPVFEPAAVATATATASGSLGDFAGARNAMLLPDPHSFTVLPWAGDTAWLRADTWWPDGSAVLADPRRVLQRALADLARVDGLGLRLRCGLELEFHIYKIVDDALATADANWPAEPPQVRLLHPGYQLLSESHADLAHEALAIVRHTAQGLGLPLLTLEIELGPSQFEAVFAATDALTAADHMLLFRNGVRQALRRAGYLASFVCKPPLPHAVASGWHLHQSLVDGAGRNAMAAESDSAQSAQCVLSARGQHWLAGLLQHAAGMTALCAPTVPAYSRYQGSVMAPQRALWGFDNRGAMLRVVGQGEHTRIENRLGEPLANPYLMMAAQVFAGIDGLQQGLQPPPPSDAPYASAADAAGEPAAASLPTSLAAALDAFAKDTVLQQGLGPQMAQVFAAIKRQELARHAQAEDKAQWERREYFGRF